MNCNFNKGEIIRFDNGGPFIIRDKIGEGASSVVYRVIHTENHTEHLLKEYHPTNIQLSRDINRNLYVIGDENDRKKFYNGKKRFADSYKRQIEFRNDPDLKNETSNIQNIYSGYGTVFIDMTCFSGNSYDKVKEKSLVDLLKHIKAITKIISCYHQKGYLHLDIKPENVFILSGNCDMVMLFDFDSVIAKADLKNPQTTLLCTPMWAAPEQMDSDAYRHISECTDLYSIGMVFFNKLTGRFPDESNEHKSNSNYAFDRSSKLLQDVNEKVLGLLTNFFRHTICKLRKNRWQSAEDLIHALDELLNEVQFPTQSATENRKMQDVGKQISKLGKIILISALLICLSIAFVTFVHLLSESEEQTPDGPATNYPGIANSQTISNAVVETKATSTTTSNTISNETTTAIEHNPISTVAIEETTTTSVHSTEETTYPSSPDQNNSSAYSIDTVAYNLQEFRSLILTNNGAVYYINGNTIWNSASSISINMRSDFDNPLTNGYLAYDPYNDIVYLLAGGPLSIYDISDFSNPKLIIDSSMTSISLAYTSTTPQIAVLPDGSLLVPADSDGTYRVDVSNKYATRFTHIYNLSSPYYAHVVGDYILTLRKSDTEATVAPLYGGEKYTIQLEKAAPYYATCSLGDNIWFYADDIGVCQLDINGTFTILIDRKDITVKDYQPLKQPTVWSIATNENNTVVFYDNLLKCIRCISPAR